MPPRVHRNGIAFSLLLLAAPTLGALAGCADQPPPVAPRSDQIVATAVAPSRELPTDLFDDAMGRVVPSFADRTRALEMQSRLEEFVKAYEAGDDRAARSALASARRLNAKGGAHAANLSALSLAIGRAEALLDSTTAAEAESHE
jgi:hypothetical protein